MDHKLYLTSKDTDYGRTQSWNAESSMIGVVCPATFALSAQQRGAGGFWFDNLWTEIRFIKIGKPVISRWSLACWTDVDWDEVRKLNLGGYDCYYGVCPRLFQSGTAEDVPFACCLWADVDAKHFKGGKAEAFEQAHKSGLPKPTFLIDSGHGYHLYWDLEDAYEFPDKEAQLKFGGYLKGIAKYIGGDAVHDVSRVMRIAYTINWKDRNNPVIASVVETGQGCIPISEFQHLWQPIRGSRQIAIKFDRDLPQTDVSKLRVGRNIKQLILHPPAKGGRSEACFRVITALHKGGYSATEIKAVMKHNPVGDRYYEQ